MVDKMFDLSWIFDMFTPSRLRPSSKYRTGDKVLYLDQWFGTVRFGIISSAPILRESSYRIGMDFVYEHQILRLATNEEIEEFIRNNHEFYA